MAGKGKKKSGGAARKREREEAAPAAEDPPSSSSSSSESETEEQRAEAAAVAEERRRAKRSRKAEAKDMGRYVNKQRTLVFSTRGVTQRDRHLMNDVLDLLPHSKKDSKLDVKARLQVVNEVAEMRNCNNTVLFEARKRKDLYMWVARTPEGPSIKFGVDEVTTLEEIKLTGNALKGSRALLHFSDEFDSSECFRLTRELLTQVFGCPKGHPKAMPFVDKVFSFFLVNGRIYFRNFQIIYDIDERQDKGGRGKKEDPKLVEIGPRFSLTPIRVFGGAFGGPTLWSNGEYVSPNELRAAALKSQSSKYDDRVASVQRLAQKKEASKVAPEETATEVVFK